ncbi:hypothetical protein LguiB_025379 [Lonicera macranthoides]
MDSAPSDLPPSTVPATHDTSQEEHFVPSISDDQEIICWGCGLRLLLSPYAAIFKCSWCGAITNQNAWRSDNKYFWWKRFQDRCFVSVLLVFMFFMICGGIWAIYPVVFSISYFCGIVTITLAILLSISTIVTFSLSAFRCAGAPPIIPWGSYPIVGKGGLENYTYCLYCSRPKSPRTHHCSSCGMCVLNMDHHCPFIGNCVGASNHRCFILFLISAVTSTIYVTIISAYAALHIWPPVLYKPLDLLNGLVSNQAAFRTTKEILFAFLRSTLFLSPRGFVLAYLFIASASVEIGLGVLLWQQLCYIYEGKTYLSHLSSRESDGAGQRDCQNFVRFFSCAHSSSRYLPNIWKSRSRPYTVSRFLNFLSYRKRHKK